MASPRVALVTLGCARNEVDSEELAARFAAGGFELVSDASSADAVVVNTCGFVEQAKQDSIDTLLEARGLDADGRRRTVVAVGCLAERYGTSLASSLPEADAVLGFDSYASLASTVSSLLAGESVPSHAPADRRLLPLMPVEHEARVRLETGPVAPLKIANGCDRRCSFCAIPMFRGRFVSRSPAEVLSEARWLASEGVRELHLVSENSTSYGKDLGDVRLLETLLPALVEVDGIERVRIAYLQPAEMRPSLVSAIVSTPGVADYFDLSFQHASTPVLRRMRRFGGTASFLGLIESIRSLSPEAGIRSNFIVGFPGETRADYEELEAFLSEARLDAVGVFRYSDEDGTEAVGLPSKVRSDVAARRYDRLTTLAETLTSARAEERVGTVVSVLVESVTPDGGEGRAEHQAPEVDGSVSLRGAGLSVGSIVPARVVASEGVDLVADVLA
jgi:ribosomal protein S12 methylthiotransferase RimO